MPPLAVLGNLSRDLVDGAPPRVGGAPYWSARALRELDMSALVAVKCADFDRRLLAPPVLELGLPVLWLAARSTAAFSFHYVGDRREMTVDELGEPWTPEDIRFIGDARWVHVGALARSDFPAETLAELADGRTVSLDGQGLVRPARTGPLELDAAYDPEVLRHVSILKLNEEEARVLVGGLDAGALASLGVPEVLVTLGSHGSLVLANGTLEEVDAERVEGADPTGAGDAFAVAYLASRAGGAEPVAAARRATELVAQLLRR
ncbi:MAG: carbohydrate kinase [Actinobacteria bacterium]|nr:MAG: carbohydrate kinase [Actinomycetota bacterium]